MNWTRLTFVTLFAFATMWSGCFDDPDASDRTDIDTAGMGAAGEGAAGEGAAGQEGGGEAGSSADSAAE